MPISNNPKIKLGLIRQVRQQLEHRATWLALLAEKGENSGAQTDFAREAVYKCGQLQGAEFAKDGKSFVKLKKKLFTFGAKLVFEMKFKLVSPDKMHIRFHYCPLVAAWQKMGCTDDKIAQLCDTAMCGDRGIASAFDGEMLLDKSIARGDERCEIRFEKAIKKD